MGALDNVGVRDMDLRATMRLIVPEFSLGDSRPSPAPGDVNTRQIGLN